MPNDVQEQGYDASLRAYDDSLKRLGLDYVDLYLIHWPLEGRYSDAWHVQHLADPQSVVPESIMPPYAFLRDNLIDGGHIADSMTANSVVGVPYTEEQIAQAQADFLVQADPMGDTEGLLERYPGAHVANADELPGVSEMDALVAYLQVLGTMVDFSTFTPDASR